MTISRQVAIEQMQEHDDLTLDQEIRVKRELFQSQMRLSHDGGVFAQYRDWHREMALNFLREMQELKIQKEQE